MNNLTPITRREASEKGLTRYFTGKSCVRGHVAERLTSNAGCVECLGVRLRTWRKANPEHMSTYRKKRYRADPEKARENSTKWYKTNTGKARMAASERRAANPEKARAAVSEWRKNNLEKARRYATEWRKSNPERARANVTAWHKANPEKINGYSAKRRAVKAGDMAKLTPEEKDLIQRYYTLAKEISSKYGEPYDVDHIIPLAQGGPHHPDNLQVISHALNCMKNDSLTFTFPEGAFIFRL